MLIEIRLKTYKALVKAMKDQAFKLQTSYFSKDADESSNIKVDTDDLSIKELELVKQVLNDCDEGKAKYAVSGYLKAVNDPEAAIVRGQLENLPALVKAYFNKVWKANNRCCFLIDDSIQDSTGVAYLPVECEYTSARDRQQAYVTLTLAYNHGKSYRERTVTFVGSDLGQTLPVMLHNKGRLIVVQPEMLDAYDKVMDKYERLKGMHAQQVQVRKVAVEVADAKWWWNSSDTQNLTANGRPTKGVIDMDVFGEDREYSRTRASRDSKIYDKVMPVPTHPVLPVWSLAFHNTYWVNVVNIGPHKYEDDLSEKLVLPQTHRKLIGALVSNLEVLREEADAESSSKTLKAKATSNIILAMGPPGTGKTLTAEVYANEIQRPLYEVASGQLGSEPEAVEENLQIILDRAARLKMPLLINEADVFIRARGDDFQQNAICATFLRQTEYYTGLIFLTTNRRDIDDAMKSRAIAEFHYTLPEAPERKSLWKVLLKEFNLALPPEEQKQLVSVFPSVVGRDIQNLLRLTSRVCYATKEEFNLQALIDCAAFKGIEVKRE